MLRRACFALAVCALMTACGGKSYQNFTYVPQVAAEISAALSVGSFDYQPPSGAEANEIPQNSPFRTILDRNIGTTIAEALQAELALAGAHDGKPAKCQVKGTVTRLYNAGLGYDPSYQLDVLYEVRNLATGALIYERFVEHDRPYSYKRRSVWYVNAVLSNVEAVLTDPAFVAAVEESCAKNPKSSA